jgi:hypothetical protein
MKTSWKTTALGITTVLAAVAAIVQALLDNDPATNPDFTVAIAAITSGIGLIFARDNNVTSEKAGAQ